jgi:hypothetical protein
VTTPPDEDIDPDPPSAPPVEVPSGRVVVPAGRVDVGQLRAVTFPVAGPVTYVHDFGACRDGCSRAHQGNDLIGDRLQPLLAMHDGVIDHLVDHPTAGYGVVIRDAEGWEYHVYHVNNDSLATDNGREDGTWRFAEGIVPGASVRAGQLIGWMGDSGNSEGSVPHAHVEIHRPGGDAINPYWSLRQAQRDVNCRIRTVDADPSLPDDTAWLDTGWATTTLPAGWIPLALTGGHPNTNRIAARMWVGPHGHTPVDAAALRVGDARYDHTAACAPGGAASPLPTQLAVVLATIRAIESGGDYTAASRSSSASGAYQFIDSSWGGYGGYTRALHAPPPVQDAKAAEWATAILQRNGGDVTAVPVSWYLGHVPVGAEWDTIPPVGANTLTPRQYQQRWMAKYAELLGRPDAPMTGTAGWQPVDTTTTCHTVIVDVGTPAAPQLVLTQAQRFLAESTGRAIPATTDPCDPARQTSRRATDADNTATPPARTQRRVSYRTAGRRRRVAPPDPST